MTTSEARSVPEERVCGYLAPKSARKDSIKVRPQPASSIAPLAAETIVRRLARMTFRDVAQSARPVRRGRFGYHRLSRIGIHLDATRYQSLSRSDLRSATLRGPSNRPTAWGHVL